VLDGDARLPQKPPHDRREALAAERLRRERAAVRNGALERSNRGDQHPDPG